MKNQAHARYLNFHGQKGARLCRDQSIYEKKDKPKTQSSMFTLINVFLYYAPRVHLKGV